MGSDEPLLTASEVAAMLNIGRTTLYAIPFFRRRAIYVRPRMPRWSPADVRLYMTLHTKSAA